MAIKILMPALSPTMTEGNLAKWLKSEGDIIKPGDVLAEIETDKATMEVESVDGGVLAKILVPAETENVAVNDLIAILLEDGDDASVVESIIAESGNALKVDQPLDAIEKNEKTPDSFVGVDTVARSVASPLAKRLAKENNISLSDIAGSGPRGRVIKIDIEEYLASHSVEREHDNSSVSSHSGSYCPRHFFEGEAPYEEIKLSNMRKVIAKRLTESKQSVPHFYLSIDCEIDQLFSYRKNLNDALDASQKLSVNDFVLKAVAKSLKEVPEANTSFNGSFMRQYKRVDLSVAVAIDGGLVTPVIKGADMLSLLDISGAIKDLASKARAGKLTPEEYQGGTFSISNLGMYGIKSFAAVINPPQACILAVGAAEQRPIVIDGRIKVANVMSFTLSVDHRVVDGAVGAKFLQAFKKNIENPLLLLV